MSWKERDLREVLVLPLIVGIMLVPIGLFSGACPCLDCFLVKATHMVLCTMQGYITSCFAMMGLPQDSPRLPDVIALRAASHLVTVKQRRLVTICH